MALSINDRAELVVRAPLIMSKGVIEKFINDKRRWILSKIDLASKRKDEVKERNFRSGEEFFFLGEKYKLKVIDGIKKIELDNELLLPSKFSKKAKENIVKWYKREALVIIKERVKIYSEEMNLNCTGISINSASKRWGSCTGKNKLNFTYKLVMAPIESVDYVVVHELAHIKQKNHSKKFWNEVAFVFSDYKKRQKWLKDKAHLLEL